MIGYTKLFEAILASSIWERDPETCKVWVTLLAMKNKENKVEASLKSLAHFARISVEKTAEAVAEFEGPDPDSRSQENEGRRIRRVEGGWLILNGERYQKMLSVEERREYNAAKQREYRYRKKELALAAKREGAVQAINEGFKV
mgnify:CR=1 FL=1